MEVKNKSAICFMILAVIFGSQAAPLKNDSDFDPMLMAEYFEGDIILDTTRTGRSNESFRWPNNTVFYRLHEQHFDQAHTDYILSAMRNIEAVSCIRFIEATPEQIFYVNITGDPGGCTSNVGYLGRVQKLNLEIFSLDVYCFKKGNIMHELLHTLGFFHMQSASNRDAYVKIIEENIMAGREKAFQKRSKLQVDGFDEEYDYASVMHYGPKAFSKNGKPTIVALKQTPAAKKMGQRHHLTKSDINRLNVMYRCSVKT